jgi:uncharacterized membrane protein
MTKRSALWGLALGLVVASGVAGAHRVAFADAATQADALAAPAMGPHAWVAAAMEQVSLTPEQRTAFVQLQSDVKTESAPVIAAHDRVLEAVAASVESGAVDHATLDPLVAAAQAAAVQNRPVFERAADRLHALLTQEQRQALVDALRANLHATRGAHHDPLAKVAEQIGLTSDQVSTIRARVEASRTGDGEGFGDKVEHFRRMKALADAFVSDSFDAHAAGIGEHASEVGPKFAARILSHIDAALPVLTPAQRTALAAVIRARRSGT